MNATSACGLLRAPAAAEARRNFWFSASVDAKFMRASIAPVENQLCPSTQPATFGGSYSSCPMLIIGDSAVPTEKPVHPVSLMARTTNSAGHEYLVNSRDGSWNADES